MSIDRTVATATVLAPSSPTPSGGRLFATGRRPAVDLFLTWTDPVVTGTASTPRGLALGNAGRRSAADVTVDVPGGATVALARLRRNGRVLVAALDEPGTIAAAVSLGTVFVDWTDGHGHRRSAWLRVPPVPSRFRAHV
jgi:hypothetical protein